MIEREPATEDEMILAFLRVEVDPSNHWSDYVKARLAALGAERLLIDDPNLNDPAENCARKEILDSYRGYRRRKGQFAGFPVEVTWYRAKLQPEDFQTMHYMADPNWNQLSNGTRLVSEGARNLPRFASDKRFQHIVAIAQAIRDRKWLGPLIAAQRDGG